MQHLHHSAVQFQVNDDSWCLNYELTYSFILLIIQIKYCNVFDLYVSMCIESKAPIWFFTEKEILPL